MQEEKIEIKLEVETQSFNNSIDQADKQISVFKKKLEKLIWTFKKLNSLGVTLGKDQFKKINKEVSKLESTLLRLGRNRGAEELNLKFEKLEEQVSKLKSKIWEPSKVRFDTKKASDDLKRITDDIEGFTSRIKDPQAIKLSLNIVDVEDKIKRAKKLLKDKTLSEDKKLQIKADINLLKQDLTKAKRELRNFLRTWKKDLSVLGKLFWWVEVNIREFSRSLWLATKRFVAFVAVATWLQKIKEFFTWTITTAISFESAFAWVEKTVNATNEQLGILKSQLKDLTKEIPLTFEEIAGIAEVGWQLNIPIENLKEFTRVIAQVGASTRLTTEEAAEWFAKLANVTQLPKNQFDRLGAALIDLWNNSATTESKILEFANRTSAISQIAGVSTQDILWIATAFSSLWVEAEAWGTAIRKTFKVINKEVLTWWENLEQIAEVANMTSEQFVEAWETNAAEAFTRFIEWVWEYGKEWTIVIEDLISKNVRLTEALQKAAWAGDILRTQIERANKAFKDNNALQKEAEKRFNTTESKLKLQRNRWQRLQEAIWRGFLPTVVKTTKVFVDLVAWMAISVFSMYIDVKKYLKDFAVEWAWTIGNVKNTLNIFATILVGVFHIWAKAIGGFVDYVATGMGNFVKIIANTFQNAWTIFSDWVGLFFDAWKNLWLALANGALWALRKYVRVLESFANPVKKLVQGINQVAWTNFKAPTLETFIPEYFDYTPITWRFGSILGNLTQWLDEQKGFSDVFTWLWDDIKSLTENAVTSFEAVDKETNNIINSKDALLRKNNEVYWKEKAQLEAIRKEISDVDRLAKNDTIQGIIDEIKWKTEAGKRSWWNKGWWEVGWGWAGGWTSAKKLIEEELKAKEEAIDKEALLKIKQAEETIKNEKELNKKVLNIIDEAEEKKTDLRLSNLEKQRKSYEKQRENFKKLDEKQLKFITKNLKEKLARELSTIDKSDKTYYQKLQAREEAYARYDKDVSKLSKDTFEILKDLNDEQLKIEEKKYKKLKKREEERQKTKIEAQNLFLKLEKELEKAIEEDAKKEQQRLENKKKIFKDVYKTASKYVDETKKAIDKETKALEKATQASKDFQATLQKWVRANKNSLKELNKEIDDFREWQRQAKKDIEAETSDRLAGRFLEIEKEKEEIAKRKIELEAQLNELQNKWVDIKLARSIDIETLKKLKWSSIKGISADDLSSAIQTFEEIQELSKKQIWLDQEGERIKAKVDNAIIKNARSYWELTQSRKIELEQKEKARILEEEASKKEEEFAKREQTLRERLNIQRKALKWEQVNLDELTDFNNQEYARDLNNKNTKLQLEIELSKNNLDKQKELYENYINAKSELDNKYLEEFKEKIKFQQDLVESLGTKLQKLWAKTREQALKSWQGSISNFNNSTKNVSLNNNINNIADMEGFNRSITNII